MCSRSRGPSIVPRKARSARGPPEGGEAGEDREAFDGVTWRSFRQLANVRSRNNKPGRRAGQKASASLAALRFTQVAWTIHARRARSATANDASLQRVSAHV